MPRTYFAAPAAQCLAQALLARRMPVLAQDVLERCRSAGQAGLKTQMLGAAAGPLLAFPSNGTER
jgi:hypothetical protein